MAHTLSARKRMRQSQVLRARNKSRRSALRTQLKKAVAAVSSGNAEAAQKEYAKTVKALDVAAQKKLIHKNEAARRKSRLAARLSSLAEQG